MVGRVIESRRAFLNGKSLTDIENETEGLMYQKLLSRIEFGDTLLKEVPNVRIKALANPHLSITASGEITLEIGL
jgi:hypothetical protein